MKQISIPASLVVFLVIFISCSVETIPSSKASGSMLRHYHAMSTNRGTTYVKTYFIADAGFDGQNNPYGKPVELDAPSKIFFNDTPMEFHKGWWLGTYYIFKSKKWPGTFKFAWTDNKGKAHVTSIKMDIISLASNWLINYKGKYAIVWTGSPIKSGEEVRVSIGGDKTNWHYSTNKVGAQMIVIGDLPVGFDRRIYHHVEITRTLTRRIEGTKTTGKPHIPGDGIFIKLIYSIEE